MFIKSPKPISISLSPNTERDDIFLALKLIFQPWRWKKGKTVKHFEEEFKKYFGVKYAVSFNSGRSCLFAILKSLNFNHNSYFYTSKYRSEGGEGKNVLLQAFTCNAVPNPILWLGLNPVYVDCNKENFNIDIEDLRNKIAENPDAKILIVQHTFGLPAEMDKILEVCRQNNLILIEDCAHSLGAEWKGQKVGTFGKAAFFSFSRDKVISSVYGGIAVTNDEVLAKKLKELQKEFRQPSFFWVFQQLLHPILLNYIILPIYNFLDLGKIFLVLSQWLNILSKAVHWKEKRGLKPDYFPRAMPNALAILALNQFKKLDKFYLHRKKIADYYKENLKDTSFVLPPESENAKQSYLRFTIKHPKAHEIIYDAWHKENILLGDWYTMPVAPYDTNLGEMKYKSGSCPNAEELSKTTLNLPTHINISQKAAERIVSFLRKNA